MIWIDYIIITIISLSCLISLIRGFIREILSLVVWGCTFFITSYYYAYLSTLFTNFEDELIRNIIAIVVIATVILIVGAVVNSIVSQIIKKNGLSETDRILGASFGILRGILIVSIILFFLDTATELSKSEDWQKSQLIPKFNFVIRWFLDYLRSSSNFLIQITNNR